MVAQTSYSKNIADRVAGLIYDLGNTNIDSFAAEGIVGHGRFVSRGTNQLEQCVVDGAAGAIGVSVRHASENDYQQANVAAGSYKDNHTVAVLREGYIWTQFDAAGGTLDGEVTITANGVVQVDGLGTALTILSAYIERPAIDMNLEGQATPIYIGLVRISAF